MVLGTQAMSLLKMEPWSSCLEATRVQKVVGSNPSTIYWMDIFSQLFVVIIVMFV